MKKFLFSWVAALSLGSVAHGAPISITGIGTAVGTNFDGLGRGTNDTTINTTTTPLPAGLLFTEQGANANNSYRIGTGTTNLVTGDTYSYGTTANATDRAFGTLRSSSNASNIGLYFQNNTSSTINSVTINYTGEQYRLGATGRADRLDFAYLTSANDVANQNSFPMGTYTDVNQLDFSSPFTTTVGQRDGNLPANQTAKTFAFNVTLASNEYIYFRFSDFALTSGAEDGLAIDDFSLRASTAAVPEPSTIALFSLGLASLGAMRRRKKQGESGDGSELV